MQSSDTCWTSSEEPPGNLYFYSEDATLIGEFDTDSFNSNNVVVLF